MTLPEYAYEVFRYENMTVNKYGFISIDTVKCGLSPGLHECVIQAKIYADKIETYHDRKLLKTFKRSYEKNAEVYDWREYLDVLTRKPGAVPHTRFFRQMPKLWQEHLKNTENRERKNALMILSEIVADGNDTLCDEALKMALESGRSDADSIRQCYYLISKPEYYPQPFVLLSDPVRSGYAPDLTVYDSLLAVANMREGAKNDEPKHRTNDA